MAAIAATETADVLAREGIEVLRGRAVFTSPRELRAEGRGLRARRVVIATGSRLGVPPGPGLGDIREPTRGAGFEMGERAGRAGGGGGGGGAARDGLQVRVGAGVRAVVKPGGAGRDPLSVEAAAAAGVPMYLTGTRHFAH